MTNIVFANPDISAFPDSVIVHGHMGFHVHWPAFNDVEIVRAE
jgi:hypothetical protein